MKVKAKEILELWQNLRVYELLKQKNRGKQKYVIYNLPDVPDGEVRYEQLQNKVLKDAIFKYRLMSGYDAYNTLSWDYYDPAVEKRALSKLTLRFEKDKIDQVNQTDLRSVCREYAVKSIEFQKSQFEQLGIFNHWSGGYLNMHSQREIKLGEPFAELQETGYIQKGRKPVHWCIRCKNTLANVEIEFLKSQVRTACVKFPIMEGLEEFGEEVHLPVVISPLWNLAAIAALVLNPYLDYLVVQKKNGVYLVSEKLFEKILSKFPKLEAEKFKILDKIPGAKLNISSCSHPLTNRELPLFYSKNSISNSASANGSSYLIPGHSDSDYSFALKNSLDLFSVIHDDGAFTDEAEQLCGLNIFESDEVFIHELTKRDYLTFSELTEQLTPHCYQCKNPLIIRMIDQWFFNVEANGLKSRSEEAIRGINWSPEADKKELIKKIKKASDWCISCQRLWGVSVPIFYCERCDNQLSTAKGIKVSKETLERFGAKSYSEIPLQLSHSRSFIAEEIICGHCGAKEFRRDNNILDSQFAFLLIYNISLDNLKLKGSNSTADLYLENQKLHQKWMPQSLFWSMSKRNYSPFKNVLVYPSSNLELSHHILKNTQPDVLRAWLIEADEYSISQSEKRYESIKKLCFSLLKSIKHLEQSEQLETQKLKPSNLSNLSDLDKLVLNRLRQTSLEVTKAFKANQVKEAYSLIYELCVEIKTVYLNKVKKTSKADIELLNILRYILSQLLKLMAPILSYTSEAIWQEMSAELKEKTSLFFNGWTGVDLL